MADPDSDLERLLKARSEIDEELRRRQSIEQPEKSEQKRGSALPAEITKRYEVMAELGRGGMGIVCKARDRETGEMVALKVLKPDIADDATFMERFKRELRLARKITHKNVCRVHEFNRAGDAAYISMEYVDGESLRAVLRRFGSLPLRKGLEIASQICAGLHEAHTQGVVHRDLKPENVMIDREGHVKIMDFGIAYSSDARLTTTGTAIGTPGYMAPEQVQGKDLDPRADVYALGCILYEVFTGAPVFKAETPIAVALKHLQEAPRSPRELEPALPARVEQVVLRCLKKDPGERFASVEDLEAALTGRAAEVAVAAGGQTALGAGPPTPPPSGAGQTVLVGSPTMTPRAPAPAPAAPPPKSHAALVSGLVAAGVLAAGLVVFLVQRAGRAPASPSVASAPQPQARAPEPETRAPAPEAQAPPPRPAPRARPAGKTVQLNCFFNLREATLTISGGKDVIVREVLRGEKRRGFPLFRGGFFGQVSKPMKIPAGARELSVRVVGPEGVNLSATIPVAPPAGPTPTLQIQVAPERLKASWHDKPSPRPQ